VYREFIGIASHVLVGKRGKIESSAFVESDGVDSLLESGGFVGIFDVVVFSCEFLDTKVYRAKGVILGIP